MALQNKRGIYDLTPMTMVDYPNQLACIIWFADCSMRCPYCYNPDIVLGEGPFSFSFVYSFLNRRKGLLDGVVLSGGECTIHPHIKSLCLEIKKMGFKVKIDTNGTRPDVIQDLIDSNCIDYIALDYKAPEHKFESVTGIDSFSPFSQTLDLLINQTQVDFEVRTTVHSSLLHEQDVNHMIDDLSDRGYNKTYFIQRALDQVETLAPLPDQKTWLEIDKLKSTFPIEVRTQ